MLIVMLSMLMKTVKNITEKINKLSDNVMSVKPKVELTIEKINSIADIVKPKVGVTIEKINTISENVNKLITTVNDNVHVLSTVVEKAKYTADNILDFERKIQDRIEPPVLNTVNKFAAISVGVKTFFSNLKSTKKNKNLLREDKLSYINDSDDDGYNTDNGMRN